MKNFFIVVFLGLVLGSCSVSQRASWHVQRAERLDPTIFKRDTITKLVPYFFYLDTNIKFQLKDNYNFKATPNIVYETDTIENEVKILPSFDTIVRNQRGLTAKIWMNQGELFANLSIDSVFYKHVEDSIRAEIEQNEIQTTVTIEKQISWLKWLKWLKIALISLVSLVILVLIVKILKLF